MKLKLDRKLFPIILLAAMGIILLALTVYNIAGIASDKAELKENRDILEANTIRRDYLLSLTANRDVMESKIEELSAMLPRGIMQNDIFSTVQRLGERYDVSVSQVTFDKTPAEDGIQANRLGFTISMDGRYENIMRLLEDLAGVDKLTHIKSLTINAKDSTGGDVKTQATVAVYYH